MQRGPIFEMPDPEHQSITASTYGYSGHSGSVAIAVQESTQRVEKIEEHIIMLFFDIFPVWDTVFRGRVP
jgi:hypothetical protein